jgi:Na+/melibiose symporter-like transporter
MQKYTQILNATVNIPHDASPPKLTNTENKVPQIRTFNFSSLQVA